MNEAGDMESFNNIKPWLSEIDIYASDKVCKLLVGKKCDLVDSKVVHTEKAKWHKSADIVSSRAKNCVKIAQLCVDADQHRRPTIDNIIDMLNLKESLKDNNQVFSQEKKRSNSIQLPTMDPGETHFTSKILCNDTTSKVTDIYSLEFCFPFEPNKRLHCPMTLTNMTNHYVGVWITPISANLGVNKSFEDPCSFFLMKPNSTWIVTLAMKEHAQQQLPSQDTRKFKMVIVIMELEIDHLKLESPYGSLASKYQLLKLVIEESQGKLTKAMVSAAIDNTVNCKIVTIHQAMSPRMSEDGFCMALDVHPIEPWIIMGHDGGLVSIWNYKTQQMVKEAFKMTTRGVCSVKFITRDQSFAVAVGDTKGWVHIFNNSPSQGNKKIESFKAHPDKCVDSLAVHPTCPILLSSSCEDNMVKRWDWHQGWACTRIFEGHTSGVRCLTFNPRDANIFASIGVADDTKVWNINSSNAITLPTKKVDYFFSDRRNFLISCDDDQIETAEIWDMQTKDHLRTLGVFMRRKLLKNAGVDDHDRGNSSKQKSGHGSEILAPGPINKANVIKNNGNKDSGTKENQGGRGTGDDANNVTGAGGRRGAGHPAGSKGKGQTGASAPTSTPIGHTSSSMPSGPLPPPGTATAGLYSQSGGIATYIYDNIFMDPFQNSMFRDDNVNLFSDENPNSCSVT